MSGFQLAVTMSNAGGAWDNAKKFVEKDGLGTSSCSSVIKIHVEILKHQPQKLRPGEDQRIRLSQGHGCG